MKYIDKVQPYTEEMIGALDRLIKYPSVEGEPLPGKPFGEVPAACLKEALEIADEMGFATKNMENYCGYAEMGSGKDIVGICAHLDVVPAGEGWNTDPFKMARDEEKLYGRGVSDDKGGLIASLYAMKLVRDSGVKLNKRVRLVMGCNEETGSKCMDYYCAHGEPITVGFTPDADFPGIFGEMGQMNLLVKSKKTKIISMNGGFVSNAVCGRCETKIPADSVCEAKLREELAKTPLVSWEVLNEDGVLTIKAQGVAAHASTPLLGINAAGHTMEALKKAGMEDGFVDFYTSHIGVSCDGEGMGCKVSDDYGALSFCNGIVKTEDGVISCTIDIRYPVTLNPDKMRALIAPRMEDENGVVTITKLGSPLFYPEDGAMVKDLVKAYQEVTGDMEAKPYVMGGGTYAKHVPGIIAFGCAMPGDDNHIHDANEYLYIKEFEIQVAVYMQAILNLLAE